ncbi:hypothetical protein CDAR_607841 [Caerostris darwini]|uniref:Uncharacterized protein n=1 Tax=Caerostris darwini TaxID=1538125 RepID=A0AAV4UL34_9ARAC|nr:hypothetical protein CDAR_607841 [Caerostris darwini]
MKHSLCGGRAKVICTSGNSLHLTLRTLSRAEGAPFLGINSFRFTRDILNVFLILLLQAEELRLPLFCSKYSEFKSEKKVLFIRAARPANRGIPIFAKWIQNYLTLPNLLT